MKNRLINTEKKAEEASKPKKQKKTKTSKNSIGFKDILSFFKDDKFHRVIGIFLILFALFLSIAFTSYFFTWFEDFAITSKEEVKNLTGKQGMAISKYIINEWFGIASYIILFIMFILGVKLFIKKTLIPFLKVFLISIFWILWIPTTIGFIWKLEIINFNFNALAGAFGLNSFKILEEHTGRIGTFLILLTSLIIYAVIVYNFTPKLDRKKITPIESDNTENNPDINTNTDTEIQKDNNDEVDKEEKSNEFVFEEDNNVNDLETFDDKVFSNGKDIELEIENKPTKDEKIPKTETKQRNEYQSSSYNPKDELPYYKYPKIELLDDYSNAEVSVQKEELESNKTKIVNTLNNYGISIDKIKAVIGPTVTLYELVPAAGIRISKIKGLEDDIAMSLSALGIRIIAPMPGKGTIGIEVPNKNPEIVSMKSLLNSDKFANSKFELPIALGKTISNEAFIVNLTKLPHLLMAGATGQGKSVGLNAILTSLLYKKHPSEIKFVLIDPKKVELTLYEKIERHFLAKLPDSEEAIITDTRKVVRTLNSLCIEMDNRFNLLKDAQVRNIQEYNEKFCTGKLTNQDSLTKLEHKYLPYIVLVVDEFADLIMTAGKEVETPLTRLAQLARAIGIHLIIATQRPTVNIITGTIKANFPARIAFRVVSKIDSRTVLDSNGADQLVGRGDMLLATGSDVLRLQCAFIDIHELERLTSYIGEQSALENAYHLPEFFEERDELSVINKFCDNDRDEYFEEAAKLIVQSQHGSTSLIQRRLKLGFNRAGRIIDQLEKAGIVGNSQGSKTREVIIKDEMSLERLLMNLTHKDKE